MLDYCLNISDQSYMHVYTPDALASSFPFTLYEEGYFEAGSDYYTIRDGKPMYLLLYTVSGAGTIKVDGKLRQLPAGYAALIDCRAMHEYRTVSKEPWCFHWVHFDSAVMAVMLYRLFFDIVETYGGNPESILDERDRTPEMREREAYADKTVKAALHKGKKLFLAVSLLTAISSALFPMLEIYFNEFFMIDLVIRTLFVILTSTYIVRLKNGVKVKAGLDFD